MVARLVCSIALVLALPSCSSGGGGADAGPADAASGIDGGLPTALSVDCRQNFRRSVADYDIHCAVTSGEPTGNVGSGPPLGDTYYEGFVDQTHVIIPSGVGALSPLAIYSLDPTSGARTVISGTYLDPRAGMMTVGTGPDITNVFDSALGPDGYYFLVNDSMHTTSTWGAGTDDPVVLRVDPATGARTEVLDFGPVSAACTTGSGQRLYPDDVSVSSSFIRDRMTIDVAHDGTIYTTVAASVSGRTWAGVAAFTGGHCRLVSVDDSAGTDGIGTGFGLPDAPPVLRLSGAAAYVLPDFDAVIRIDLATGDRELVSTDDAAHGVVGEGPAVHRGFMSVAPDGTLFTAGGEILDSLVTAVDPTTGDRTGITPLGDGGSHSGRPLFGVDRTHPFLYLGDSDHVGVIEYSTGNYNIIAH